MVEWNDGIANSAKMMSKRHNNIYYAILVPGVGEGYIQVGGSMNNYTLSIHNSIIIRRL